MGYIADGEFPDDELTDITYMLQSNDNYSDLFHDLAREDDGEGTRVRIGKEVFQLARVMKVLEQLRAQSEDYPQELMDGDEEVLISYFKN